VVLWLVTPLPLLAQPRAENIVQPAQADPLHATASPPAVAFNPEPNPDGAIHDWERLSEFPKGPEFEVMEPYWVPLVKQAFKPDRFRSVLVPLDQLIADALAHSPHIRAVQLQPLALETQIKQADAEFDPKRFVDGIFHDTSDPVGNALTVGSGGRRLEETFLDSAAGMRMKTRRGGKFEGAQELDFRNNNSQFFTPLQQADTKLVFRYTQPFMKGSGQFYNRSSIMIAQANASQSRHEAARHLEKRMLEISQAYWTLYYQRALYAQLARGTERLHRLVEQIRGRMSLDVLRSQYLVAEAEYHKRQAERAEARLQILTQEARLRSLTNSPWLASAAAQEIIPDSPPLLAPCALMEQSELDTALHQRGDILAFQENIRAAKIQFRVAEADLRPTLDLVTDMYVRGLNGDYDVGRSIGDQFSLGSPSYSAGLQYLRPKGNRLAIQIKKQRSLELQKLLLDLDDLLAKIRADILAAVNKASASGIKLQAAQMRTLATREEVEKLQAKWASGGLLDAMANNLVLDELLDAEIRLIAEENNWAAEQATYMISLAELRFETGSLLCLIGQASEGNSQPNTATSD
jgi:outer membrane protein TolC